MATLHQAMCRLCLQSGSEISTVSIFSIANGNVIAEIAERCIGITIVKDSSPYENVCSTCIVSLVSVYELYLKYQECNRAFIQMLYDSHRNNHEKKMLSDTVEDTDAPAKLEDIIEEDYSIDDELEELESSSNTLQVAGPTEASCDEPVYCLQEFGSYVRPEGGMESLLQGQLGHPQHQHLDESGWDHHGGQANKLLMEELNAQVARLDGQEITSTDVVSQPSAMPQPSERSIHKRCQTEENNVHNSALGKESLDTPVLEENRYQEPTHHCYVCQTSFQNDIDLVNHFPAHFLEVPKECSLCSTQHRTVMNLNRHLAYHQPGRPYKCGSCERRFSDLQAYQWHVSEFHSREQTKPSNDAADGSSHTMVCDICGKLYVLGEPYEHHVRQHEQGHRLYQCKLCERYFPRNIYLLFHLETHAKHRPHRCQYCSIPFASLYLKNFHEKRHPVGDGAPVSRRCPLCFTVCRAKHRLLAHIEAVHPADTRIQLLQCSFNDCRLKFLDLNEFQNHITAHRVGDRLPCMHCIRVFKRQRLLNAHLRTVHGLVVQENELKRGRVERRHPALRCDECSKTFRSERTHRLHLEVVHSRRLQEDV